MSAHVDKLTAELQDFTSFRSKVIIRNELRRQGFLLLSVAVVAGFMNVLVLNAQGVHEWTALPVVWFSATGSGWLLTGLLKFLAYASVIALLLGGLISGLAPFLLEKQYRRVHADFVARGWVATGIAVGLSVDDDNLWIRKPVEVRLYSPAPHQLKKHWESDQRLVLKDADDCAKAMLIRLLLADRQFHGARTVKDLRALYEVPEPGGYSLVGFGPLQQMDATGEFVVVSPASAEVAQEPQAFDKLVFWIRNS